MRKEKIMEIEKYIFDKNDTEYYVYVSKNKEDNFTEFYFGKKDYGIIDFKIGFYVESEDEIEEYIKMDIDKWIGDFENSCEKWDSIE